MTVTNENLSHLQTHQRLLSLGPTAWNMSAMIFVNILIACHYTHPWVGKQNPSVHTQFSETFLMCKTSLTSRLRWVYFIRHEVVNFSHRERRLGETPVPSVSKLSAQSSQRDSPSLSKRCQICQKPAASRCARDGPPALSMVLTAVRSPRNISQLVCGVSSLYG